MSMRKPQFLVGAFSATLLLAACSSSGAAPSAAPPSAAAPSAAAPSAAAPSGDAAFKMCLLTASADTPYSTGVNKSAAEEAARLGHELTVLNSELDAALQASQMDQCIAQKVDGVIVVAVDAKGIVPAIKKASEAGILVLADGAPVDASADPYTIGFSGPGDYPMAQLAGKMAADYLPNGGKVAIVSGSAGFGPTILRENGFKDFLKDYPNIEIIDTQNADWSRQKAIQVSADMLTRFGDTIDLFYTLDDGMGIGVTQSIKAANSKAKVVSLTAFPDSCPLIEAGDIIGTVIQSSTEDGKNAVQVMERALKGETVPRENYMNTPQLTKENIEDCPKA